VPTGDFLNATDPDLSLFKANGGKLLMWNGWADPVATPVRTVQYFLDVVDTIGDDTLQFSRLFMASGVHHCGGGSGPNTFDMLGPLENWVERGVAPHRIIASHLTGNVVDRTRPLCAYPREAKYFGNGSVDDAANFVCRRTLDGEERD
jgi:feruloyl esterase